MERIALSSPLTKRIENHSVISTTIKLKSTQCRRVQRQTPMTTQVALQSYIEAGM